MLSIEFTPTDTERINELSEKARAGVLTEGEHEELDSYLHVGNLLTVVQSKARRLLKSEADPART